MSHKIEGSVKIKGIELDYELITCDESFSNDGIGPYEYWGAPGYDMGRDYVDNYQVEKFTVYSSRRNSYVRPSDNLINLILDKENDDILTILSERISEFQQGEADYYADMKYDQMMDDRMSV